MQLLSVGTVFTLVQNEAYGLPSQTAFVTASAAVEVSLDLVVWDNLANALTGVVTGARAVRSTLVGTILSVKSVIYSSKDANVIVPSTALPTAPLGQVLISQGDGIPPIFSSSPSVNFLNAQFAVDIPEGGIGTQLVWIKKAYLVADDPNGALAGQIVLFRDLVSDTPGAVAVGGGTKTGLAIADGTNWYVISGKTPVSGGALPTAPVGQVLVSQGDGITPAFSASPLAANFRLPNAGHLTGKDPANVDVNLASLDATGLVQIGDVSHHLSLAQLWTLNINSGDLFGGSAAGPQYGIGVGQIRLTPRTVAQLPVPDASLTGSRRFVTDATVITFSIVVTGGGALATPVYCDGVAWRVG